jgi:hypothetical protein
LYAQAFFTFRTPHVINMQNFLILNLAVHEVAGRIYKVKCPNLHQQGYVLLFWAVKS